MNDTTPAVRGLSLRARTNTAYWAAGHAMVTSLLETAPIARITIVPSDRGLGYVMCAPKSDAFLKTRDQLVNQLVCLMAGVAASEVFTPEDSSTGCSNDLQRAVALAQRISGITGEDVETLLNDAQERARTLLVEKRDSVEAVAQALLAQQTLSGEELAKVVAGAIH